MPDQHTEGWRRTSLRGLPMDAVDPLARADGSAEVDPTDALVDQAGATLFTYGNGVELHATSPELAAGESVDPAARRRGVGRELLQAMIDRAGSDERYTLEVRTSNAPAIALYERFDFRSAGMRPRYYRDTGEDAVIMWRGSEQHSPSGAAG